MTTPVCEVGAILQYHSWYQVPRLTRSTVASTWLNLTSISSTLTLGYRNKAYKYLRNLGRSKDCHPQTIGYQYRDKVTDTWYVGSQQIMLRCTPMGCLQHKYSAYLSEWYTHAKASAKNIDEPSRIPLLFVGDNETQSCLCRLATRTALTAHRPLKFRVLLPRLNQPMGMLPRSLKSSLVNIQSDISICFSRHATYLVLLHGTSH